MNLTLTRHCTNSTITLTFIVFRYLLVLLKIHVVYSSSVSHTVRFRIQIAKSLREDDMALKLKLPGKLEQVHDLMRVRNDDDAMYTVDTRYESF